MTIYTPMISKRHPKWTKSMHRRWSPAKRSDYRARVTRSFGEQWKRYRNSKNILALRSGEKTHTGIFPMGYDPTYIAL